MIEGWTFATAASRDAAAFACAITVWQLVGFGVLWLLGDIELGVGA